MLTAYELKVFDWQER